MEMHIQISLKFQENDCNLHVIFFHSQELSIIRYSITCINT